MSGGPGKVVGVVGFPVLELLVFWCHSVLCGGLSACAGGAAGDALSTSVCLVPFRFVFAAGRARVDARPFCGMTYLA